MQDELLCDFAARYIWWKTVDAALAYPERIVAQVMNLGTFTDIGRLLTVWPTEVLRPLLMQAEPGWFTERSWAFWQLYLGLVPVNGTPPPLPHRRLPEHA
ncbi:MAG: hypothetical protein H0X24_06010 [Ktedonobacterales bacterium]|nr:hypothetical protein [Ktedonobacterales bacterium]